MLIGGTLQPIEETRERLFPWLPPNELHFFSCGHIVPPESIMPIAVSRGPTGRSFDFSYSSRSSADMVSINLSFDIFEKAKMILLVYTIFGVIVLHCRKEMQQ